MKAKLLKKLRKKASEMFKLVSVHNGYSVYDAKQDYLYSKCDMETAKSLCQDIRRGYMIRKLNALKEKRNREKKVIYYYPW